MRVKKLIKYFAFTERERVDVTLGPNTRLSFEDQDLRLIEDLADGFPTDDDLYVRSTTANPLTVRQWLGFEAGYTNATNEEGDDVTSVSFKLSDGTDDYYWNTNTLMWDIAGASDWSPETDIAVNIPSFPATSKQLQVVINLKTTDPEFTPTVECVKVLYSSDVEFQDDLIYRSLIPDLLDNLRPWSRAIVTTEATTSTVTFDSDTLEVPYDVVDVDSVFDYSSDPGLTTDILSSYDANTGLVTLTSSVGSSTPLYIKFIYKPVVSVRTSQDYYEVGKVPAVVLRNISIEDGQQLQHDHYVGNKDTGEATVIPAPLRGDLEISALLKADKDVDNQILSDEVKRFFGNNTFIRSRGTDEKYRLWLDEEHEDRTDISQKELHTYEMTFRIKGVLFWYKDAYDDYIVMRSPQVSMNQK